MRNARASDTEAELGGFFENCQNATSISTTPEEMGHTQPPRIVETDNTAEDGIVYVTEKQKISITIYNRFY